MKSPYWITHEGVHISLAEMTTTHILAAMTYLAHGTGEHGPMYRPGCSGFTNSEWLALFKAELLHRSRMGRH